jgi:lipoprotein-anchoring transpeptidase ErfK/SrfK
MRRLLSATALAGLALAAQLFAALAASDRAEASVVVEVNRSSQTMSVIVDGAPRYHWRISTGRTGLGTPGGTYHPQSMQRTWYSRIYHNSPMPHSIFFTGGIAIHGTYEVAGLGRPVSHGCVRLDPANAAELFGLVQREGMHNTTIVVH